MAVEGVTVLARHRELKGFHRIAAKAHDIVPLGINRKLPRVDAGNVQEVADEPVHLRDRTSRDAQKLLAPCRVRIELEQHLG